MDSTDKKSNLEQDTRATGADGCAAASGRGKGVKSGIVSRLKERRNRWLIIVGGALSIMLIVGAVMVVSGGSGIASGLHGSVAIIDVAGEIGDTSARATYDHAWTVNTIEELIESNSNKGLAIRVNTPGGSVYTSDELYEELLRYKEETGRPVYAYFQDEAASGGYYIAMAADKIYANRNTWTGSIGVTTGTSYDVTGLLDKLGIKTNTITSGRNKAMGSPTTEMTEEQKQIMQSLVDEAYSQFVGIVAKGRKLSETRVREIADGRIYSAKQAKELGLIDGICNEDTFYEKLQDETGLGDVSFKYMEPDEDSSILEEFITQLIENGASGKVGEYQQLIELSQNSNKFTIKYMAEINK